MTDEARDLYRNPTTMTGRLKKTLRGIWAREPWWAEFWAGVSTVLWAVWPYLTGDGIDTRPTWFVASLLLDEHRWQYGGMILGCAKIFILLQDAPYVRWLRLVSCFFGAWFWSFLATSLLMVDAGAPSVALYIVPALINVYSMVRLQPHAVLRWEN